MVSQKKNISMAKAVLASIWRLKTCNKTSIVYGRYCRMLCADKHPNTTRSTLSRLTDAGLINCLNGVFTLTEAGKKRAMVSYIDAEVALHDPNFDKSNWDGGWRIIIFDIPESKRRHRDSLRNTIKALGFKEIQKSIWLYPFPVPQFIKNIILDESIRPHVRFITADNIDNDQDLRKTFGLAINTVYNRSKSRRFKLF